MKILTLHVPASPDDVVQSDLVLPSQPDPFEAIPFGRCQLLSGTNSNAHTSYSRCDIKTTAFVAAIQAEWRAWWHSRAYIVRRLILVIARSIARASVYFSITCDGMEKDASQ